MIYFKQQERGFYFIGDVSGLFFRYFSCVSRAIFRVELIFGGQFCSEDVPP